MEPDNISKNITEILEHKYVVPLYQRNFAWGEEEISQLLQDIYDSFLQNNEKEENGNYYIGSLVVIKRNTGDYEVIDGQQRLTAITLIAKILDSEKKEPKLFYDSRQEVEIFYRSFYQYSSIDTKNITFDHKISHFFNAVDYIKNAKLNSDDNNMLTIEKLDEKFKKFFFNNVILVLVELPQDTDVANYFEIMNNRGQQLQKHEVIKAKLLDNLKDENGIHDQSKQKIYSKIWNACSQMNTHIQKLFVAQDRKILFGENYDFFPTKRKIEQLILDSNVSTNGYFEFSGYLKEGENTLIIQNNYLSGISVISGELCGAWINNKKPVKSGVFALQKDDKQIDFQMQIYDDVFVKGVKARILQEGKDIVAKIIWAKSSKKLEIFGKNWDDDEYSKSLNTEKIATSENEEGYGICKMVLNGINVAKTQGTIKDILEQRNNSTIGKSENQNNEDDVIEDENNDKSIIDFPNFLMHILRLEYNDVYKEKKLDVLDIPLNEKDLLTVYDKIKDKINPQDFIFELLYYRTIFDRFIVKATTDENVEEKEDKFEWTLKKPYKYYYGKGNTNSLKYGKTFENEQNRIIKALSMLQVTFRTRIYKNWLQEVLSWFKYEREKEIVDINEVSYINKLNSFVLDYYNNLNINIEKRDELYSKGTNTPHFLFNFIDYLYWVESKTDPIKYQIKEFDFRYRNSVEHHRPQSRPDNLSDTMINCLGNLCLVSKSSNSRMNNEEPIGKAKVYYNDGLTPKRKRMYDITNIKTSWSEEEIKQHYEEIVVLLNKRNEILR